MILKINVTSGRKGGGRKSGKRCFMELAKIIEFPQVRNKKSKANIREKLNAGKTGSVFSRGGKLWVDFRYLYMKH